MGWGTQFAENAAGSIIDAGMGLILGGFQDRRQINQQKKLQSLQIEGQKQMMDYGYDKQLEMWKNTSYPAQLKMMQEAGINPGLMYGMGGGGGTTTGSPTGNVTGGQAPSGGGEAVAMMGMGIQKRLLEAQERVLQTQADLNEADANKKKGIDTQEGVQRMHESETRIESLLQGIDNAKQQHQIQKLEITLKNMENFEKQASQEDRLDYIEYQTKIAAKQLKLLTNEGEISDSTMQDKIKIVKENAIGAVLNNLLTQEQTKLTTEQKEVARYKTKEIAQNIMRDWDKMSQTEREIRVKESLMQWQTDPNREALNQSLNAINSIMGAMKKGTTIYNVYD